MRTIVDTNIGGNGHHAVEPVSPCASPAPTADLFADLSRLRISPSNPETLGIQKRLNVVQISKPKKEWWVRVNPQHEVTTFVL